MLLQFVEKPRLSNTKLFLFSLSIVITTVFFLAYFFEIRWQSNDDVGMSMIAHGYGIAKFASSNILFSNVLWGYIVRAIPKINGILGYSIATLSVLIIFGTVVLYGLYQMGVKYLTCLLILVLILVPPVLFPQFTINAGILQIGAIICWRLYKRQNDWRALTLGCLLAFCSYLIRNREFLLVLIVASPLLPWKTLLRNQVAKTGFLLLGLAIAASAMIDYNAYQGKQWQAYNNFNPAPFTDFRAGEYLKQHNKILEEYGYSNNDIDLIANWFFVDPSIANPTKINAMLTQLGPLGTKTSSLAKGWEGLQALSHPKIITLVFAALVLFLLRPTWRVAISWGLSIAAIFFFGLLGRPGTLHVYIPLLSLLLIAPFLDENISDWRDHLRVGLLFLAALVNTIYISFQSQSYQIIAKEIRKELEAFPSFPIITWGAMLPYESLYPVLRNLTSASYQYYSLGSATLAPFSVSYNEQKAGRGLANLLVTKEGIPIMAAEYDLKMLAIYCAEHFHGKLEEIDFQQYGQFRLTRQRCSTNLNS